MVRPFAFFPTPYPDEILYSILCRFHLRIGSPAVYQTNQILWNKRIGQHLIMPQMLDRIIDKIPAEVGLTVKKLVDNHTLYPYFRPFFREERWLEVFSQLRKESPGKKSILHVSGFIGLKAPRIQFLRYCDHCWREDISRFGEMYWHRVHQLPGVMFCPVHASPINNSNVMVSDTVTGFYPASSQRQTKADFQRHYSDTTTAHLLSLSMDSEWILENSSTLGFLKQVNEIYDLQLRKKGFRGFTGQVIHHILYEELCEFYNKEVLEFLEAYDTGLRPWTQRLIQLPACLIHPIYHLLLMRFLAGSAEYFFENDCKETLPFGEAPWPCRNHICEYHLKDVIEYIELRCEKGRYKAVFTCPHCGMVYRRKQPVPKEKQYTGQIYIADYGWKWKERLKEHFCKGSNISVMVRDLYCDYYTIKKYGVYYGFLPTDQKLRRYQSISKDRPAMKETMTGLEKRAMHRSRWITAISENPSASRKELFNLEHESYLWLRTNDIIWYETNTPAARKSAIDWAARDNEYLEMVTKAIEFLKSQPTRPCLISVHLLKKHIGIPRLPNLLKTNKIPKTAAYLKIHLESREEWRKRKIYWAVQDFFGKDTMPTLYEVMAKAGIVTALFIPIKEYAFECINQIFKTNME